MNTKTILTTAAALSLVPMLAFAQTADVTGAVTTSAQVTAPGASVKASASLSASAVATAKSRADKEIDRRIASLNDLNTRIGQMTRVTADFKTQLSANIQTQVQALTTLKSKIDADTDDATLKTDVQSITADYRIYMLVMPQSRIAAAADRAVNVATMESALGAKLKARIDAATAAGKDTTALNTTLVDLATQTTNAVSSAQAGVSAAVSLQPDNGDKTIAANNAKALQDARTKIQDAQKALVQSRKDIDTIVKGLKSVEASASATGSATTQTQ